MVISPGERIGLISGRRFAGFLLALRRGRRRRRTQELQRPERFLEEELWNFVLDSIELWPKNTARQRQHYERSRWIIRFLYSTALRASEAAGAKTSDFYRQRGRWWLRVQGKGGHTAASHQANAGVELRFVQENLRHASLQTTSIYLHAHEDLRHARATGQESASQETRLD
jgi:integrase